ncbi:MAG: type II secretion system protein [Betaproteobacteria bacterium]|nr:type II secretion system protein [Betaproteobacteria bacterium]
MLLFAVAIAAAGLAGTGIVWHTTLQREKEAELLFIGNQYRAAIASYYARTPGNLRRYPGALEELLKDPRSPSTVRHLRKLYRDPITNTTDWGLIAAPGGGIMGVYSKSEAAPFKRADFDPPNRVFEDRANALKDKMTYKEWQFAHVAPFVAAQPGRVVVPQRPRTGPAR